MWRQQIQHNHSITYLLWAVPRIFLGHFDGALYCLLSRSVVNATSAVKLTAQTYSNAHHHARGFHWIFDSFDYFVPMHGTRDSLDSTLCQGRPPPRRS
jgi:hypothetical protein